MHSFISLLVAFSSPQVKFSSSLLLNCTQQLSLKSINRGHIDGITRRTVKGNLLIDSKLYDFFYWQFNIGCRLLQCVYSIPWINHLHSPWWRFVCLSSKSSLNYSAELYSWLHHVMPFCLDKRYEFKRRLKSRWHKWRRLWTISTHL